ncbi:MAG: NAD(P)-binding domain-containing protein, partial [Actinomycetes bacterium]
MPTVSVVVVGGGPAGLAVSYLLSEAGVEHIVLERGRTAERWRSGRWDSMRLLTPNWMSRLPGWTFGGQEPDGFDSATTTVASLGRYAASFAAPVLEDVEVRTLTPVGGRYRIRTDTDTWTASAVVLATGHSARPAVPTFADELPGSVIQVTPDRYRNPADLPRGTVLVVGASATGVQIADELAGAGREVVLAVGRHSRVPRRYRGHDIFWWLDALGVLDQPAGSPSA